MRPCAQAVPGARLDDHTKVGSPLRYALDLTKRVYLESAGFVTLLPDFVPLVIIGLVTLSGAAWLFRRRLI